MTAYAGGNAVNNRYRDLKRKVYTLLNKADKLQTRLEKLRQEHDVTEHEAKALYRLLQKVVSMTHYDAPEVSEARTALDRFAPHLQECLNGQSQSHRLDLRGHSRLL